MQKDRPFEQILIQYLGKTAPDPPPTQELEQLCLELSSYLVWAHKDDFELSILLSMSRGENLRLYETQGLEVFIERVWMDVEREVLGRRV